MPHQLLTPRVVDTLKAAPGAQRTNFFDTHADAPPGFCLRVSASRRVFYLVATDPTTKGRAWVKIGDARQVGLDAARRAAKVKAGELARGLNPNDQARAGREARRMARRAKVIGAGAPTVAQLVKRYIAARRLSPVTEREYHRTLRVDIEPHPIGSRKAADLIRGDVREYLAVIERRAPVVRDHALSLLRAAYQWGQVEERAPGVALVERDPTIGLEFVANRRKRSGHLTDEQIPIVWSSIEKRGVIRASYVRLLILLGLRRGEAHVAKWADVDFEHAVWRVPTAVRKVRVDRKDDTPDLEIPLAPLAVSVLRELQAETGKSGRLFHFSVGEIGQDLKDVSGLRDVMIHDLRRTLSEGLERLGAPPHVVSMALGHAGTKGATASDLHYILSKRPGEYRTWLERWANHVQGLLAGEARGKVLTHPSAGPHMSQ